MQQLFRLMNKSFRSCTGMEGIALRTYAVIPLSAQHGVIQWVAGTSTLGEVLLGSSTGPGLHKKYYPQDISNEDAKRMLHAERDSFMKKSSKRKALNSYRTLTFHRARVS